MPTLRTVQRELQLAVERGHFPQATLLVCDAAEPVWHQSVGRSQRLDLVYDLASLTKVLCTSAVAMQLCAEGRLDPRQRVQRWLPASAGLAVGQVRLEQLLAHCSGLPAWVPLFRHPRVQRASPGRRRAVVRRLVLHTALEARPGTRTAYSDLGFILLAWILERCGGARLDRLARRLVYRPLGLSHTLFVEHARPGRLQQVRQRYRLVPTERCPWRKRRLLGEVHDDNCHQMGGIAGHAGLFSTAHEVHLLVRELVAAWNGESSLFHGNTVRRFLRRRPRPTASRVLGWDTPSPTGSSAGTLFGPHTVGHLGFTGTSLWIDLDRRLWVVLLTNRVHRGREPNPMPRLRPRLHDAVLRALER